MPIHMECAKCMNVSTVSDNDAASALCSHCRQPLIAHALPAVSVLVVEPRSEVRGLSFDVESAITLAVFALLLLSAIVFYVNL